MDGDDFANAVVKFQFDESPQKLLDKLQSLEAKYGRALDHEHVVVWRGWYSIDGAESETVRALAVQDRETTVEEDIHLVESVQRGMRSRGYVPGPLVLDPRGGVNSEHSVRALQSWMKEAIDGHANMGADLPDRA